MDTPARHDWMDHPLGPALAAFNLLPSRYVHASRQGEWLPPAARPLLEALAGDDATLARLHRQASAVLLQSQDLGVVDDLAHPCLPLFLADADLFERLTLCCGLVLLAPAIRHVIAREEVAALREALGERHLAFARLLGTRLWAGEPSAMVLDLEQVRGQALALGAALLARACVQVPQPLARRALLRLPLQRADAALPESLAQGDAARRLALKVLEELDPPWLSFFPVLH